MSDQQGAYCRVYQWHRSGGGRVVKLLACGARGPGFDSQSCHLNFRDWLSPASKLRYGWNTSIQPTTNQYWSHNICNVKNDPFEYFYIDQYRYDWNRPLTIHTLLIWEMTSYFRGTNLTRDCMKTLFMVYNVLFTSMLTHPKSVKLLSLVISTMRQSLSGWLSYKLGHIQSITEVKFCISLRIYHNVTLVTNDCAVHIPSLRTQ